MFYSVFLFAPFRLIFNRFFLLFCCCLLNSLVKDEDNRQWCKTKGNYGSETVLHKLHVDLDKKTNETNGENGRKKRSENV